MTKKIGDLLALGLLAISVWILTSVTNALIEIGKLIGLAGAVIIIIVEGYFIWDKWIRWLLK